jgi:hypothetical protein
MPLQAPYLAALAFLGAFVVAGALLRRGRLPAPGTAAWRAAFLLLAALFLVAGWCAADGVKAQWVRLIDVFFYGPLLMWAGWALRGSMPALAPLLLFLGATTLSYNARNFALLEGWMAAGRVRASFACGSEANP